MFDYDTSLKSFNYNASRKSLSLDLSRTNFGMDVAKVRELSANISTYKTLKSLYLDLSLCQLTADTVKILAEAISELRNLVCLNLNLDNNWVGSTASEWPSYRTLDGASVP